MNYVVYGKHKKWFKIYFLLHELWLKVWIVLYLPAQHNAHLRNVCRSETPLFPGTKLHGITTLQLVAA